MAAGTHSKIRLTCRACCRGGEAEGQHWSRASSIHPAKNLVLRAPGKQAATHAYGHVHTQNAMQIFARQGRDGDAYWLGSSSMLPANQPVMHASGFAQMQGERRAGRFPADTAQVGHIIVKQPH
eukprot:363925-Chlamydomonas_euryale.AAC.25